MASGRDGVRTPRERRGIRRVLERVWSAGAPRYAVFKLGRALLVVVAATLLTQVLLSLAPGGVAQTMLGEAASPEAVAQLEEQLGLDRPILVQYGDWATDVLGGDLGRSPISSRSVGEALSTALPVTLQIVVLATVMALGAAILLATTAARRPGGLADRFSGVLTSAGLAIPTFVLAPILLYVFAVQLELVPVTGWVSLSENVGENLRAAILPATAVAIPEFAVFQRLFRADLVAVLEDEYIEAARARGISETRILLRHAFRPASIALLTVTGLSIGRLLGGTIIVESLFALPGVGQVLQQAIVLRDLVTVQGLVAFFAISYVVINFVVDVLYGVIDPRIRSGGAR